MADNGKRIYVAGDQQGHPLRKEIMEFLRSKGTICVELGVFEDDDQAYNLIERELFEKVNEEPDSLGLLVFGKHEVAATGEGEESKK
ncbi:hypothetical protein KJ951_02925 [Patescibacteria group bacterium]|nr:hypothetical protein [Patescibacteria group bacterium]MBU1703333.1 hypothetical protein [Patescibacteria group bacterium]MBU1954357.1 hypothetical protein [Patescibacteria group bacterium]